MLHCRQPDGASGGTSWDASFSAQTPAQKGVCVYRPDPGELYLSFTDVDLLWPFAGGESSHLENNPNQAQSLSILGHGALGDSAGTTSVGSSSTCSKGCEVDVLPKGSPLGAPGEWVTYRFVVTCHEPLGSGSEPQCTKCMMDPQSFTVDAACYFPPAGA
jgi:hypothetical protein